MNKIKTNTKKRNKENEGEDIDRFILDPDDNSYINDKIFTKEELEEIRDYKKRELPEIPEDLINYIMKFSDNKIHELRRSLTNDNESISENYVRELHHDIDWFT
ncbi:9930_t:CDS:2 [Entrophospora sp. SA101]|nr:9930_t:CDS:2 [Entrophospora sp. SA101]CAJ0918426.1 5029_t:CDS:2 [Entrophospora sp. SA101]